MNAKITGGRTTSSSMRQAGFAEMTSRNSFRTGAGDATGVTESAGEAGFRVSSPSTGMFVFDLGGMYNKARQNWVVVQAIIMAKAQKIEVIARMPVGSGPLM